MLKSVPFFLWKDLRMNSKLYAAITDARAGQNIAKAQDEIAKELAKLQFSGLLHILSNYFRAPVFLSEMNQESLDNYNASLIKTINLRRAQKGKPALNGEGEEYIKSKHNGLQEHQGIRYRNSDAIYIIVANLNPLWLAEMSTAANKVTNADLVHMAVAHEVIGMLFAIDTYEAVALNIDKIAQSTKQGEEEKTHSLAVQHFLNHILSDKDYHRGAGFYNNNRADLLIALGVALNGIEEVTRVEDFSVKTGVMISTLVASREVSKIKECPVENKLMCPNGNSLAKCGNATDCIVKNR